MSDRIGIPVYDFDSLRPITMTIITTYDIEYINLPAIFAFLPVTDASLPPDFCTHKKQGKIVLPSELNRPGEILSMRFNGRVRGIVRSEVPKGFSHSIILDIGTSHRIVSAKLSTTIELTGPTSMEIGREVSEAILGHVRQCQEDLDLIQSHKSVAERVKRMVLDSTYPQDPLEQKIYTIFARQTKGYPRDKAEEFLDFMLAFNRRLYTGSLRILSVTSAMVNILFSLGFAINQKAFSEALNYPPFYTMFNNVKNTSAVAVLYHDKKVDRKGRVKLAKHTIRVYKSGHVRYSGPSLESMRIVYNAFMYRVLNAYHLIKSCEGAKYQLKIYGKSRALSVQEWKELLEEEERQRQKYIHGQVVMVGQSVAPPLPSPVRESYSPARFDYQPLVYRD